LLSGYGVYVPSAPPKVRLPLLLRNSEPYVKPKKSIENGIETDEGVQPEGIPSSGPTHGYVPSSFGPYVFESKPERIAPEGEDGLKGAEGAPGGRGGGTGFAAPAPVALATETSASATVAPITSKRIASAGAHGLLPARRRAAIVERSNPRDGEAGMAKPPTSERLAAARSY
jgi:hypothetical protein